MMGGDQLWFSSNCLLEIRLLVIWSSEGVIFWWIVNVCNGPHLPIVLDTNIYLMYKENSILQNMTRKFIIEIIPRYTIQP